MNAQKITFGENKLVDELIYEYNEEEIYEKQLLLNAGKLVLDKDDDEEEIHAKITNEDPRYKQKIIVNRDEIFKSINIDIHAPCYIISNYGNIVSFKSSDSLTMKPYFGRSYPTITLSYKNKNYKYFIHTLVAKTFVDNPNPDKFNQVNHIDGIKINYQASNLEWCDQSYNTKHAQEILGKCGRKVEVRQLKRNGELIEKFESIKAASISTGLSRTSIAAFCEKDDDEKRKWSSKQKWGWEYVHPRLEESPPLDGKEYPGFPGYSVTSDGRVYSSKVNRFMRLQQDDKDDYVSIWLSNPSVLKSNIKGKKFYVHKLVAELYLDPVPGKTQANHIDRDKEHVNVINLEWVTPAENVQHCVSTGVSHSGRKAVTKFSLEGEKLGTYASIVEASNSTKETPDGKPTADTSSIGRVCNPRNPRTKAGKFLWKLATPDEIKEMLEQKKLQKELMMKGLKGEALERELKQIELREKELQRKELRELQYKELKDVQQKESQQKELRQKELRNIKSLQRESPEKK